MTEKTIWGIHMDWSLGLSPIEKNFIAIGWDKLGDLSKLAATRDALKGALAAKYAAKKPEQFPLMPAFYFASFTK